MKKMIFAGLCVALSFGNATAQQSGSWCGTDHKLQEALQANPLLEQQIYQENLSINSIIESGALDNLPEATKYIPVVVHVLHDNGTGNISDAQVQDALDVLNADYNRQNSDTSQTRNTADAPFKPHAASMDVQFILAKVDPNGNCTNGIVRKSVTASCTYDVNMTSEPHKHTSSGGSDAWPRNKYFNIWVVNSIDAGGQAGIILGYAQFPFTGSADEYGITIRHDAMGTIETAAGSDGNTLTHEVGHCWGLYHTFQGDWGGDGCHSNDCNTNGDWCCDTPPSAEAYYNCNSGLNSCNDIPTNDAYGFDAFDQIENFMSYNSCQNMFSQDQATRMEAIFQQYSWASQLVSAANTDYTGINEPLVLCSAEFSADKTNICAGDVVTFTDETFNTANGWTWNFQGGTPATSTAQNPSITYNSPGIYEVTLTATDGSNNDTETKTSYIRVQPAQGELLPYLEGFEMYTTFDNIEEWTIVDHGNNVGFELTEEAAHSGGRSAKLANYGQAAGNFDEMISEKIDLSPITGATSMTFSFRYAHSKRTSANDEWLKVYVSGNCGTTWSPRKTLHGDLLSTNVSSDNWIPGAADWVTIHMTNITSTYWTTDFRYKFEFESDGGNNLYIDDINIYSGSPSNDLVTVGLEEVEFGHLTVFPNPSEGELNVRFDMNNAQQVDFTVQDLSGKVVKSHAIQAQSGSNLVVLGTEELATGMYFLNINSGGKQQTIQFAVK